MQNAECKKPRTGRAVEAWGGARSPLQRRTGATPGTIDHKKTEAPSGGALGNWRGPSGRENVVAPAYLGLRPATPDSDLGYHSAALWAASRRTPQMRKKTTNRRLVEQECLPLLAASIPAVSIRVCRGLCWHSSPHCAAVSEPG